MDTNDRTIVSYIIKCVNLNKKPRRSELFSMISGSNDVLLPIPRLKLSEVLIRTLY